MLLTTEKTLCAFCGGALQHEGDVCGDRPDLAIGVCADCNLKQVFDFSHVSLEHYESDDYFPEDPAQAAAVWQREEHWNLKRIERLKLDLPHAESRRILDFGCGIGGFLKRSQGHFGRVTGFDLSRRVAAQHQSEGFACVSRIEDAPRDVDTIVLFHVLEHVPRPWELLQQLLARFTAVDRVVVEVPCTDEALNTLFLNSPYRQNHHSADHVWYFTNATLRKVMERAGLKVVADGQYQRYTLGNTFGWLANGEGGGQILWPWFNNKAFHDAYEAALAEAGVADSVFMIGAPAGRGS